LSRFTITRRNITCDNWFISVPLVYSMREKYSFTIVSSLRKNKPEILPSIKRASAEGTCQFAYHDNKTLVSYKSENDKMVLLHSDNEINKVENKPEIVIYYYKTKGASDTFDQLCHEYTVNRRAFRWSV